MQLFCSKDHGKGIYYFYFFIVYVDSRDGEYMARVPKVVRWPTFNGTWKIFISLFNLAFNEKIKRKNSLTFLKNTVTNYKYFELIIFGNNILTLKKVAHSTFRTNSIFSSTAYYYIKRMFIFHNGLFKIITENNSDSNTLLDEANVECI